MSKLTNGAIWLATFILNGTIAVYGDELKMHLNALLSAVQLPYTDIGNAIISIIFTVSLAVFVILPLHSLWRWIRRNERIKEKIADICQIFRKLNRKGYDFDAFDASFKAIEQVTEPKTRAKMLVEFQPKLRELCYEFDWNEEVKKRIEKVLVYIPERFSLKPHAEIYLMFIGMITKKHGQHTIDIVKEKFQNELNIMYGEKQFETNSDIVKILQRIYNFSENYVMKLIEDAGSPKIWSKQKFDALFICIAFNELSGESIKRVVDNLALKMESVEKSDDQIAYERFKKLYDLAKDSA